MMTEKECLDFMDELKKSGIVPGLGSIKELCRRLGNPQDAFPCIHIAGTNGKGSVLAYLSTVYKTAGYRVGAFSSPAVFNPRETIRVDGKNMTKKAYTEGLEKIKEAVETIKADGLPAPTAFEAEVALAFLYFADKKCDIVMLEAGMGGREDATNLITRTLAAVLMPIGMDHMQFLGGTLDKIAYQKAGIIKKGCVAVSAVQQEEAAAEIRKEAEKQGCSCIFATVPEKIKYGLKKQKFSYRDAFGTLHKDMEITIPGVCQAENAAVAIEVVEALNRQNAFVVSEENLRRGLLETSWPGRFEVLREKPYFVIDGAHNEPAAKKLVQSVSAYFSNKRIIYIMGMLKDKEYEKVAEITYPYADQIITVTPPENKRALSAMDLAAAVSAYHPRVTTAGSVEEAVEMAYLLAGKEDVILCFGSLSFLGRVRNILGKQ
mgnify:FL=1